MKKRQQRERVTLFTVRLKDCTVQTFASGGPGGQHQNKTQSGVRIVHTPSGAVGESREHRSQAQNKKAAWERLGKSARFVAWAKLEAARLQGKPSVEALVEQAMRPENIKAEALREGEWVPFCEEDAS